MTGPCPRFEEATRREDPKLWTTFLAHASECPDCREQLRVWEEISRDAPSLKKSWDSPNLWPRIEAAMAEQAMLGTQRTPTRARVTWLPIAAAASLFFLAMIGLRVFGPSSGGLKNVRDYKEPLLTDQALSEVEKSEQIYLASIERLSRLAEPKLNEPATPLLVSYREKLLLLDSAILDLRSQLNQNRFNTHLRRELAALYQEKRQTLQQVVGETKS